MYLNKLSKGSCGWIVKKNIDEDFDLALGGVF